MPTLSEYANTWLAAIQTQRRRGTVVSYESLLRLYIEPALGTRELGDIATRDVRAFLRGLPADKPSIRPQALACLASLYRDAVTDEVCPSNPAHGAGRNIITKQAKTKRRKALLPEEWRTLLPALWAVSPQTAVVCFTMISTGLRPGEALALTHETVDLERRVITVADTYGHHGFSGGTKGHKARWVDVSDDLLPVLAWQVRATTHWLFPSPTGDDVPLNIRTLDAHYQTAREVAGLPYSTPHGLRHTTATWLLEGGADALFVQRLLGHASLTLTTETYGAAARRSDLKTINLLRAA